MKAQVILWMLVLSVGCSRNGNPVNFSKISPTSAVTPMSNQDREKIGENNRGKEEEKKLPETILEYYLAGWIDRDYMMAWFFSDSSAYRDKLYDIKYEIRMKEPLAIHDRNRILFLEKGMNDVIRKFNEKNVLERSEDVISAALDTTREKKDRDPQYNLSEIKKKGAQAAVISDSPFGFLGSMLKYGFSIEMVNFLDR